MDLTILNDNERFTVRTCAIIMTPDKKKILVQKIKDIYMLPGGRMKIFEDSYTALKRELKEELNIDSEIQLKYNIELNTTFPNGLKYHEIGFYYNVLLDKNNNIYNQNNILNQDFLRDGKIYFEWIDISLLNNINFISKKLANYLVNDDYDFKHLIIND